MNQNERKQTGRDGKKIRPLVIYGLGILIFAITLLGISYFTQSHRAAAADDVRYGQIRRAASFSVESGADERLNYTAVTQDA